MVYKQSKRPSGSVGFSEKIDDALQQVESAILRHQEGEIRFSNERQLEKILHELELMKEVSSSNEFTPAFPSIIVDSWDYSNELGIFLLDLYEVYKKIK